MKTRGLFAGALAAGALLAFLGAGLSRAQENTEKKTQLPHVWDGGKSTPVHLLELRDENDKPIIPTEAYPFPYSARYTCGPCHEYAKVAAGRHFNAPISPKDERTGQPWFLVEAATGTVIPVSYRGWPGSFSPESLGLTAWNMTMLFGRNMPGGGTAEPPAGMEAPDPSSRWTVSGKAEINCLACHNASSKQDHSEWAREVLRENLRWAATAAAGMGEVGGMASRLPSTWDIYDGPNPDDHEWAVVPCVKYDPKDFDSKHRYRFDISYPPANSRCLACHSVTPVGQALSDSDPDVHLAAGLKCADCHRNDLGHDMTRGYEGEAAEKGRPALDGFTCRGCHLGEDAEGKNKVTPGRLGAPYPKHAGIPLVHFNRLTCTVCHSGSVLKDGFTRVRTSRANRLAIYGVASWATDFPFIYEPIYAENSRGKIAPNRIVWPSYWGRLSGKTIVPVKPEEVAAVTGDILKAEEHAARVLAALTTAAAEGEVPVLVSGDNMFRLNVDAGLDASAYGTKKKNGWFLGALKDGIVAPLVPDFDPDSPDKDPGLESRVQELLTALAADPAAVSTALALDGTFAAPDDPSAPAVKPDGRTPVFIMKKTLYRLSAGYLETVPIPDGNAALKGFARAKGDDIEPLLSDLDIRTISQKAGKEQTLTEEQVALILKAMGKSVVYISGGRLFRLNGKGRLTAERSEAAEPVMWPLAHDVRPAQQSLGRNGCSDCHSANSGFFFSKLDGRGALLTKKTEKRSSTSFMGTSGLFQRLFGLTFLVRPILKIVLIFCGLIIAAMFLYAGFHALGRISGLSDRK